MNRERVFRRPLYCLPIWAAIACYSAMAWTQAFEAGWLGGSCLSGQGEYRWADGSRYTGGCRNNQFEGTGVLRTADGDRYEGEFSADAKNGRGIYVSSGGDR